ncbi:hypothetical protein KLF26_00280 [Clostridium perfringens]|uniref:hypothetical protein n=1 Tax=Clostridium perfringens TaxID=1502 RepID=UPI001CCAC772|nr:hypothetical protein [Clostridium perfringens]MDM0600252.1 hypothetical protein [Clostridium perfringens]UBK97715.1 hypothetical protein KLF26_00280 [Clostridium perfringens]
MKRSLTFLYGHLTTIERDNMLQLEDMISNNIECLDDIFKKGYEIFCSELLERENRPLLLGKFLYIDERELHDGKANGFWHCSSMGEDDTKFDQDPCENDITKELCKYKCDVRCESNFLKEKRRVPCVYRANRIIWIRKIIDLVNEKKFDCIKIWKCFNKRTRTKDLKIWYDDGIISYVLIFEIQYNENKNDIRMYVLKSGYPVVLKSYKRRFQKEFEIGKFKIK